MTLKKITKMSTSVLGLFAVILLEQSAFAASACWNNPNLYAGSVDGGDTGAVVREVDQYGYNSVKTCVTVPHQIINFAHDRFTVNPDTEFSPHLYLGFVFRNKANVEAGLAYQRGNGRLLPGLVPYLRVPSAWQRRNGCSTSDNSGSDTMYLGHHFNYRLAPGDHICWSTTYSEEGRLSMDILEGSYKANGEAIATSSHFIDCGVGFSRNSIRAKRNTTLATRNINKTGSAAIRNSFGGAQDLGNAFMKVDWNKTEVGIYGGRWQAFRRNEAATGMCAGTVDYPTSVITVEDFIHSETTSISFMGPKVTDAFIDQEIRYSKSIVPDQNIETEVVATASVENASVAVAVDTVETDNAAPPWVVNWDNIILDNKPVKDPVVKKPVAQVSVEAVPEVVPVETNIEGPQLEQSGDDQVSKQLFEVLKIIQLKNLESGHTITLGPGDQVEMIGNHQSWAYLVKLSESAEGDSVYMTSKFYFDDGTHLIK